MARRSLRFGWRLTALMLVLALAAAAVVLRLVQLQLIDHDYYAREAEAEHLHRAEVRAPRGAILDRGGYPLATTVRTFDIYVDPRSWKDDGIALRGAVVLAPLLGRDPAELIASARAQESGDYLAAKSVTANTGLQLMKQPAPGVNLVDTSQRHYPEGDLASSLLGFVGRDQAGLAGLESDFDIELGGKPGVVYFERDARGDRLPFGDRLNEAPDPGGDLTLTIDRYMQRAVEDELDRQLDQHKAIGGTIIVMDPYTGEIMAMASRPSFELSALNFDDPGQADFYRNRAVTDLYSPGSVMKTITMATAIDLGLVAPETTYFDNGYIEVPGGVVRNWDLSANGTMTMTQLLQRSLNTGAVWVSNKIGPARFYDYQRRFGFGEATRVGLGGEPAGLLRTQLDDGWTPVDLATNSFGQGTAVTPLQMITAVCALVNGGQLMRPYLVKEVTGPNEHRVYEPVVVRRAVSEETSRTLVRMMNAVVDGMPGHLGQVPGYHVGGKTGTTTFENRPETIASFIGFAPVDHPRFVMLVKIDEPKDKTLGGVVAAPVFSKLAPDLLAYLGVRPDVGLVQSKP